MKRRLAAWSLGAPAFSVLLLAANAGAWLWALLAFHGQPLLLGAAAVAYGLGLRHAVDADHIAAIDNVSRKLVHEGRRPLAVGLYFSLGHSTIVFLMTLAIVLAARSALESLQPIRNAFAWFGVSVSASFLLAIAIANAAVFIAIYRSFSALRRGNTIAPDALDHLLAKGGPITRLSRHISGWIRHSRQMFWLGLLFGLGFDTASAIGLLALSATKSSQGLSLTHALIFPSLFLAAMSLLDTADGLLMLRIYSWTSVRPVRRLYYNMTTTLISIAVALLVAGAEVTGMIGQALQRHDRTWERLYALNEHFGLLGCSIVAVFVLGWLGSIAIYRIKDYDEISVRT